MTTHWLFSGFKKLMVKKKKKKEEVNGMLKNDYFRYILKYFWKRGYNVWDLLQNNP